jgi:hypothetical protein
MWDIQRFHPSKCHAVKDGKVLCGAKTKSSCGYFTLWTDKLGTWEDELINCGRCRRLLNLPAEG